MDDTVEGLARSVQSILSKRSLDLVVVVPDNPTKASMLLNKYDGLNAVVCGSAEDADEAIANKANVLIFKNLEGEELEQVLGRAIGGSNRFLGIKIPKAKKESAPAAEEPRRAEEPAREPLMGGFKFPQIKAPSLPEVKPKQSAKPKEDPKEAQKRKEEEEKWRSKNKGKKLGFMERIKDELGIMDE